jgi:outer membrane protein assembly factor BamB
MTRVLSSVAGMFLLVACSAFPPRSNAQPDGITHSFLATGGATYIRDGDGKVLWQFPMASRDGWVLPSGNILLAVSGSKQFPGGGVVEVTRDGKIVFEFKGTQKEVNTVQAVGKDRIMLTEAGPKPRLLEVDREGKIVIDVPLTAQTKDTHLQTRMARKLDNGNYLVPQLLDKVVREYTPEGKVVWEAKTPHWPFTAIRLPDGNTLVGCTLGNLVVEFNPKAEIVWQVTNDDLPGKPINDACGVQRLPNGNTVITSHHASGNDVKLIEITRDKKIVWQHRDASKPGIHHFQILDTNGKAIEGRPLR